MPIIHILVQSSDLINGIANVIYNFRGQYNVQILSCQYHDGGGAVSRVIQLRSDELYFTNSPARYLTLVTNPHSNVTFDSGFRYHFENTTLKGSMQIEPVNLATGTTPAGFSSLVLTLNVEECKN
jgi:hypothetical protein